MLKLLKFTANSNLLFSIMNILILASMNEDDEEHFPVDLSKTSLDNNDEKTTPFKNSKSTFYNVFSFYKVL